MMVRAMSIAWQPGSRGLSLTLPTVVLLHRDKIDLGNRVPSSSQHPTFAVSREKNPFAKYLIKQNGEDHLLLQPSSCPVLYCRMRAGRFSMFLSG